MVPNTRGRLPTENYHAYANTGPTRRGEEKAKVGIVARLVGRFAASQRLAGFHGALAFSRRMALIKLSNWNFPRGGGRGSGGNRIRIEQHLRTYACSELRVGVSYASSF